jgi:hypothetical protein
VFIKLGTHHMSSYSGSMWRTNSNIGNNGVIILSFQNKSDQILFSQRKKTLGPMLSNQLTINKVSDIHNKPIRCFNRWSPVNQQIQKELRELLAKKKYTQSSTGIASST